MSIKDLVLCIRSYWQSELVSVGIKVLETLEGLHISNLNGSAFHKSTSLLHMFEVSKFLLDCKFSTYSDTKKLERFLGICSTYYDLVFPLDWRRAISADLISLRESHLSLDLLEEIISQNLKGDLNYWTIGKVMMMCLGSRKPVALNDLITRQIQWNPAWKQYFKIFMNRGFKDVYVSQTLLTALEDTVNANWRCAGYISPHSFVYLLENLLFMASFYSRIFYTTRSSFVQWFAHIHSSTSAYSAPPQMISVAMPFISGEIQRILYCKSDTVSWIKSSNINFSFYHPLLSLKLVMLLSLICLQESNCSPVLLELLTGPKNIAYLLPKKFVLVLLRRRKGRYMNLKPEVVAEAFKSVGDSLLNTSPRINAPCALCVDLKKSKEEIMSVLFPRETVPCVKIPSNETILEAPISNTSPDDNLNVNSEELQINWKVLEEISEAINGKREVVLNSLSDAAMIKKELDKNISTLATALKDASAVHEANLAIVDLKLLSSAFGPSRKDVEHSVVMKIVQGVVERLRIIRPTIDDFLKRYVMVQESKIEQMAASESSSKTSEVIENQTSGGNTQDAKRKNGKRKPNKNKGKKGKK